MKIHEELRRSILNLIREGKDPLSDIVGQEKAKEQLLSSILAGRPVIIMGPPGVGKTTLAKNIAKLLPPLKFPKDIPRWAFPEFPFTPEEYKKKWEEGEFIEIPGIERFIRIQGTPDLTVEDLIGDLDPMLALKYGPLSIKSFTPGKIFRAHRGVLFFDELNRAPPKVQNALLQILEERRVTIGPYEFEIPLDFIFIATMNPEDLPGTERMSDVLLDRFDIVYMDYPETKEEEIEIVMKKGKKIYNIDSDKIDLIVSFIRYLRTLDSLEKKPSVRATLGIYEKAQVLAMIRRKNKVEIEDIRDSIISVLSHRIRLKPSIRVEKDEKEFLKEEFSKFLYEKGTEEYNNKHDNNKIEKKEGSGYSLAKTSKKDLKFIEGMLNRGILKIDPDTFLKSLKNVKEAEKIYGKYTIEYLTGESLEKICKNLNIPEYERKIKENLFRKIRELRKKKILNRDYEFNTNEVVYYLLKILEREKLKIKAYLDNGFVEGLGFFGRNEEYDVRKGFFRYYDLDLRKSIREIIKRKRIYYDTFYSKIRKKNKSYEFIVILDSSGSMRGNKIAEAKRAAISLAFCSILDENPAGIVAFNDRILLKEKPSLNFLNISLKILSLRPFGLTDIAGAINEAINLFNGKGHAILISDLYPNVGKDPLKETIENVRLARERGITFSVIGIDLNKETEEICKKIALEGNGKFYFVKDAKDLDLVILADYFYFRERAK